MKNKFVPILTQYFNDAGGVSDPVRIFYDTFTGTNGTLLSAHTPDQDDAGNGWDDNSTLFQLQNGLAELLVYLPTYPSYPCLVDVEKADIRIVTTIKAQAPAFHFEPFGQGVAFRGWFNTDQFYLLVANADLNKWYFGVYDSGVVDFVGTPSEYAGCVTDVTYDVIIDAVGENCSISIDGVERFSETLTNTTQTKHGIYSVDSQQSGTDFEILELFE